MNRRLIAAPLLTLTLLLILLHPLEKSNRTEKSLQTPISNRTQFIPLAEFNNLFSVSPADLLVSGGSKVYTGNLDPSASAFLSFVPEQSDFSSDSLPFEFQQFIDEVQNGEASKVRGVQVPGVFSLPVIEQPEHDSTYVSPDLGVATLFRSAAKNGVTGLLAHNYLSGDLFYKIPLGEDIFIVYGDGAYRRYQVTATHRFQKIVPNSLRSDLIDLETGEKKTTNEVFRQLYAGEDHVTFQTCLKAEGLSNWGLYFVVAELPETY